MPYNIGDIGPGGGMIFLTPSDPMNVDASGVPTGAYFEVALEDVAIGSMPSGTWGYSCQGISGGSGAWHPINPPGPPTVQSPHAEFGCYKENVPLTSASVGEGYNNTQILDNYQTASAGSGCYSYHYNSQFPQPVNQVAHKLCSQYATVGPLDGKNYEDWFLPSSREARLMVMNVGPSSVYNTQTKFLTNGMNVNGITHPKAGLYWTSTINTTYHVKARVINTSNGATQWETRCHTHGVRPIRMFHEDEISEKIWHCNTSQGTPIPTPANWPCQTAWSATWPSSATSYNTLADCQAAVTAGECSGNLSPCIPNEMDCYNYRDGVGGVNMKWTPRLTPIYTPGLSGSGAHTLNNTTDNVGNDYTIKTTWVDTSGVTQVAPLTARQWIHKFWTMPNTGLFATIDKNLKWDSAIGLPWFNLNFSQIDAMGNDIDFNAFKQADGSGYLIKIWDKKKRLLGSWLYDNCQVMHPSVKYHRSDVPGSPLRNEIDLQCNSFPELCKSTKLRVYFTCNGGKMPKMIDGHHIYGKRYRVIQYGFKYRSSGFGFGLDVNYGKSTDPNFSLTTNNNAVINTPANPITLNATGLLNHTALNMTGAFFNNTTPNGALAIPSFGYLNEDYSSSGSTNATTVSYAYLLIKCDYFDNSPYGYAHMNGPNTDEFHMNMICDETHGEWCGQKLYNIPDDFYFGGVCGKIRPLSQAGISATSLPYITSGNYKDVRVNCRNHGMAGLNVSPFQINKPVPWVDTNLYNYPANCIQGDPTNPCLHYSFSTINLHPWFAQFKPGDGSVPGTNSTWANVTWYSSLYDFIYDHQATPQREPNMLCSHNFWAGTRATGNGTESDSGGRGENGEYIITEFNIDTTPISSDAKTIPFNIVGDPEATFSLVATTNDTTKLYYNWDTEQWTTTYDRITWVKIGNSGKYNKNISFPIETADTIYTLSLTAEPHFDTILDITGNLSNILIEKKIYQYIDRKLTLSCSATNNASDYTLPSSVVISSPPAYEVVYSDLLGKNLTNKAIGGTAKQSVSWTTTLRDNRFIIKRQPLISDFTSSTTQTLDGAVATDDGTSGLKLTLDSIDGLYVGMTITAVSSGSLTGTPTITAIDKNETSSTYKQITVDVGQGLSDGITLTFTGTGTVATRKINNTNYKIENLKLVLNEVTTTTTSSSSDSKTVAVTSISGIKPQSSAKTITSNVGDKTPQKTITVNDDISDLGVGQTLVSVTGGDTITGTPIITNVNTSTKVITLSIGQTFTAGNKLTFASTFVDSLNICSTSKPYVESISGLNLVLSSANSLDDGETLTFTGSSNSATITADIIVSEMGSTDSTAILQLDNILTVS